MSTAGFGGSGTANVQKEWPKSQYTLVASFEKTFSFPGIQKTFV